MHGSLTSNETAVVRAAALDGAGIAMLPTYYVADDLLNGKLVRVLPEYEPKPLRLLIEFLAARFGGEVPPWDRRIKVMRPSARRRRRGVRRE